MLGPKRTSMISPAPPLTPVSPSSIPRPHSVAGGRTRLASETASIRGSPEPDVRNVRVVLRIRPSDSNDSNVPPRFRQVLVHPTAATEVKVDVDPATLIGAGASSTAGSSKRHPTFNFDSVLGESSTQVDLYDATARETVDEFMKGHNVTFLAYGQTSSGKSYSMGTTGEDSDYSGTDFSPRTGLIPRTVQTIFERAEQLRIASGPGASWECRLSFLELYNEEIIDLLSGSGVQISIREERDGRILWSGVREVKVRSLSEVMQYLYEGSTRRKTGETGMNATSSRSHAIFSLTLVQKRRNNPMTASASQPLGEVSTPTRQLKRPTSMIGMAARSPTPSGGRSVVPPSAFSKSGTGMTRPNSFVGPSPSEGDFVVVTSKFNMVDLAGSERLKRTAAQGDRMKEGISINSGLLALGNVISTLADPIKARGHVPYRDSKLTRMLQDSIGGNALTTMIACVSPIEYNINETINTIKYASRARNIKNAAKINAIEAGWDDVEHLQAMVTKLRKQLSVIETEGVPKVTQRSDYEGSEKLLGRLAELQREHTELYDRYLAKCSENMRLTSELKNTKPGDEDSLARFNETVEPVILEYEKVVGALNKQLDELRAELTNISDLYEEQGSQLVEAQDRHVTNEIYVNELRHRVSKLSERNSSSEVYIQDLETKLKSHADTSDSHGEAVTELRKEIAKLKESNERLNQHATEIEARLAKSDTHSSSLVAQLERYETEAAARERAYHDLERHVAVLDTSQDNKLLLEELSEKNDRIVLLERQIEQGAVDREEQQNLRRSIAVEQAAQAELRARLLEVSTSTTQSGNRDTPNMSFDDAKEQLPQRSPVPTVKELTPPDSPGSIRPISQDEQVVQLEAALKDLAARCAEAESRASEAEHHIADLTTQLSEAKLIHAEMDDVLPISSPLPSPGLRDDISESGSTTLQTPVGPSPATSPGRPSVGRRGSLPIMTPTNGAITALKPRDFRLGRGFGETKQKRPQSLSQELHSAQSLESSLRTSWGGPPNSLRLTTSPSRLSLPAMQKPMRSSQSLEAELKFVHEVVDKRDDELKDREAYIRLLEEKLRLNQQDQPHLIPSRLASANRNLIHTNSLDLSPGPSTIPLPPSPAVPIVEIQSEDDTSPVSNLSPSSTQRFNDLKKSLSVLDDVVKPTEESQVRIDVLLREMAVKESSQRAVIEQQFVQIADLQKANNKLRDEMLDLDVSTARNTTENGAPITPAKKPSLARSHSSPLSPQSSIGSPTTALNQLREEHADELQALLKGHAESFEELRRDHTAAIEEHKLILSSLQSGHETELSSMRRELVEQHDERTARDANALVEFGRNHDAAIKALGQQHEDALNDLRAANDAAISELAKEQEILVEEMERSLSASEEQRRQLKMKVDQAAFDLSRVQDEAAIQRNVVVKQLNELQKTNTQLEKVKADLEVENGDLSRRIAELDIRDNRRTSPMPPQGPPPTTPLPPLPGQLASPLMRGSSSESEGTPSTSTHRSTGSNGSTAPTSLHDVGAAFAQLPEPVGQMVQKVLEERDAALAAKQHLVTELEKTKELEGQMVEERVKADNLTRDLHDARKTNSKLRAHLEDSRQESKRLADACKEHLDELNDRRNTMSTLSRETGQQRDSLLAANAQVAALKAQLDRAVEQKVNKKLNNRLKCF